MAAQKSSKKILNTLLELQGVNAVTVIGRDGFVIESALRSEIDLDALGAVVSTGFGTTEVMGNELELGNVSQTIMEYETGKILMSACGDSILAVIADGSAVIGGIRHKITKVIGDLATAI